MSKAEALLKALNRTGKNFVVCIKPNRELQEGAFDAPFVLQQVRETHLVDLIRATRSIYTVQLTYNHFFRRYKSICGHRGTLESLLRALSAIGVLEEDNYVIGKVKVYLTSHQWKKLEQARFLYLNACATMIQRNIVRGAARKKSSRILFLMRSLRCAMKQNDSNDVIQLLGDCTTLLGKRAVSDIRVLAAASLSISRIDEEGYVKSVLTDAKKIGHEVLLEYALRCAEKWCPHLNMKELRDELNEVKNRQSKQKHRSESLVAVNEKLRQLIVMKDTDSLMGTLATAEGSASESFERKLGTMVVIRSLEEKSAVEALSSVLSSLSENPTADTVIEALVPSLLKVVELGLEDRFSQISAILKECVQQVQAQSKSVEDANTTDPAEQESIQPGTTSVSEECSTAMMNALSRALAEDNLVAAQKVLSRMKALGISTASSDTVATAERRIEDELSTMSVSNERKQIIKFLNIAKVSQDLELLNDAIHAATEAGLAKWDFNLKNAERERDKLMAAADTTTPSSSTTVATSAEHVVSMKKLEPDTTESKVRRSIEQLNRVWSAVSVGELEAMRIKATVDPVLSDLLQRKMDRLRKVISIRTRITGASQEPNLSVVEETLREAVELGYHGSEFQQLFDRYQQLASVDAPSDDPSTGLAAIVRFLTERLECRAELRQDSVDLLNTEITNCTRNAPGTSDALQRLFTSANGVRRRLEVYMSAVNRLESALQLPAETLTIGTLEASLDSARKAGVHERLISKAEEKILLARTNSVNLGDHPSPAKIDEAPHSTGELTRMVSDTTGWDVLGDQDGSHGDDDLSTGQPSSSSSASERDAVAFSHYEGLRRTRALSLGSTNGSPRRLVWDGRAQSQSLAMLDDPNDSRLALSINRCILGYMRDRIVFYREMLAHYLLQIGLVKSSLVDEIYLQLMKQLTKNPKRDSSIRGWSLFAMCATSFPPSAALQKYVIQFLQAQTSESNSFWRLVRSFASFSMKKLEALLSNGATGFIPSIEEICGYEARPPFLAVVELMDGTLLADDFPITPDLAVDHLVEICAHFLGLDDRVSKFLGLCAVSERVGTQGRSNSTASSIPGTSFVSASALPIGLEGEQAGPDGSSMSTSSASTSSGSSNYFHKFLATPAFLNGDVFLGDIFERELVRGRQVRFQLKIRLHPQYILGFEDELFDRMMYIQAQEEIVKGNLPLLDEASVVRFTALALAVDCGDDLPQDVDELMDLNVFDYIPVEWQGTHTEEEWASIILSHWSSELFADGNSTSPSELQRLYVEETSRHRLFGACFFACKLLSRSSSSRRDLSTYLGGIDIPSYFVLGVNSMGIHVLNREGALLTYCEYHEIVHWGGTYHQYKITIKKPDTITTEDLVVSTKYADELSALLSDYKEITALMNEA
ncbi:hypothetical protein PINS_up009563 [Pythium insidiosum]|nr:hypothetical protein PINS_up009563 [Pythium insidiosum]